MLHTGSTYPFEFYANYSRAGRFGHGLYINTSGVADENTVYGYDNNGWTHQPRVIFDNHTHRRTQLFWDANGNLSTIWECPPDKYARFHDWDDENRLRMVADGKHAGFYGYDANDERVYKLTGKSEMGNVTDELIEASAYFDAAVLYPNPYIVITPRGYTKHYYANGKKTMKAYLWKVCGQEYDQQG